MGRGPTPSLEQLKAQYDKERLWKRLYEYEACERCHLPFTYPCKIKPPMKMRCFYCRREVRLEQKRNTHRKNSERYRATTKATGSYQRARAAYLERLHADVLERHGKSEMVRQLEATYVPPRRWQPKTEQRPVENLPTGMTHRPSEDGAYTVVWQPPTESDAA